MSNVSFIEPNYRCRVSRIDREDRGRTWTLCYAKNSEEAKSKFESRNLRVHVVEEYDFEENWKEEADELLRKVISEIEAGITKIEFKSIWGELKDHLLDLFHYKCAFCESIIGVGDSGDVDHFRPKGKIDEEDDHPGYYWLAYDPDNYMPACSKCNRSEKRTSFPIAGVRAKRPGDSLEDEKPMLLNSYNDNEYEHFRYFPSSHLKRPGHVEGKTEKGEITIGKLGLNRFDLVNNRLDQMRMRRSAFIQAMILSKSGDFSNEAIEGKLQYSLGICHEIMDVFQQNGFEIPATFNCFCD